MSQDDFAKIAPPLAAKHCPWIDPKRFIAYGEDDRIVRFGLAEPSPEEMEKANHILLGGRPDR